MTGHRVKRDYRKLAPLVGVIVLGVIAIALWDRIRTIEFRDIIAQIRSLPAGAVVGAILCSAGAYLLVGLYEGIALQRVSGQRRMLYALRTTLISNPICRAVGDALISGHPMLYRHCSAIRFDTRT